VVKPDHLKLPPNITEVAGRVAGAAAIAIKQYARNLITDEPSITDRWIGAVANELSKKQGDVNAGSSLLDAATGITGSSLLDAATGITWEAKTLRSASGRGAEERRHGADLLGVAEIEVRGSTIKYGFLGQAKRAEPGKIFDKQQWDRLREQAELMLKRSPASFVLVYSTSGIRFIPAISVVGLRSSSLFDFSSMDLEQFFQLHFASYIGDPRLNAPQIKTLDDLIEIEALPNFPVEHFLQITLRVHG
jgi:hypothetical protein